MSSQIHWCESQFTSSPGFCNSSVGPQLLSSVVNDLLSRFARTQPALREGQEHQTFLDSQKNLRRRGWCAIVG
jgi:hypothetical protein